MTTGLSSWHEVKREVPPLLLLNTDWDQSNLDSNHGFSIYWPGDLWRVTLPSCVCFPIWVMGVMMLSWEPCW